MRSSPIFKKVEVVFQLVWPKRNTPPGTWNIRVAWTLAVFAWRWDPKAIHPIICGPPRSPLVRGIPWSTTIPRESDIPGNFPFTGGGCNASIRCNARGLILDLKVGLTPKKMFSVKENQTICVNGQNKNTSLYDPIPLVTHALYNSLPQENRYCNSQNSHE